MLYFYSFQFSQFSHSVVSNCLWTHGLQPTRLPCPSPTPRACSNSCPWSRWYHPNISSCHPLFLPSAFYLSQHQGLLKWVSSLHQVTKVLEFQLQHQSFQWIFRTDAKTLVFWMLSFKPTLSLSSFTFNKRFFSASSLSAMRVVSSIYLKLLIFSLAILIPACASSSPAFHLMYIVYKLNKEARWQHSTLMYSPFPVWNQSIVPCSVLTIASWPAYRFLRR